MTDPLSDERATALMSTDTDFLTWIVGRYDDATRRASFTARGLRAASEETIWEGDAADRFQDAIGTMPRQLDAVLNSFYGVRVALTGYESDVATLQTKWRTASAAVTAAATPLQAAQTALDDAAAAYRRLCGSGHATPAELTASWDAVSRAKGTLQQANATYADAAMGAEAILERFDTARTDLCGLVHKASCHAITRESFVGARRALGATGRVERVVARSGAHDHGRAHGQAGPVPVGVRERLDHMNAYIRSVMGTAYVSGGGHGSFDPNGGLDCSGFVSGVLHAGGYLSAPQTTQTLPGQPGILPGAGRYVTIYDRTDVAPGDQHVIIDINGQFYEEGGIASGGAPDVHRFTPSPAYLSSFNQVLHPSGM